MKHWLLLLAAASVLAEPRIHYSKLFPGSKPEWVGVVVMRDGTVEYREAKDEEPQKIQLDKVDVDMIFAQAEKLGNFSKPLESGLPVARMGEKAYVYEDGPTRHEVKFNYSQDADAQTLQDFMERIVESEQALQNLEKAARFDRLGVNQSRAGIRADRARRCRRRPLRDRDHRPSEAGPAPARATVRPARSSDAPVMVMV